MPRAPSSSAPTPDDKSDSVSVTDPAPTLTPPEVSPQASPYHAKLTADQARLAYLVFNGSHLSLRRVRREIDIASRWWFRTFKEPPLDGPWPDRNWD